ncbi:hypothetical protein LEP1GSC025_2564 [Leptospira interrogans str. 2002000621]|nr:hypothetical protein LEP1GSC025_2564 [Leptospira interrogans str. 2002000621]
MSFPTRPIGKRCVEFSNAIHRERCVEFFLFLGGEEVEGFSLSEKHTFCK